MGRFRSPLANLGDPLVTPSAPRAGYLGSARLRRPVSRPAAGGVICDTAVYRRDNATLASFRAEHESDHAEVAPQVTAERSTVHAHLMAKGAEADELVPGGRSAGRARLKKQARPLRDIAGRKTATCRQL